MMRDLCHADAIGIHKQGGEKQMTAETHRFGLSGLPIPHEQVVLTLHSVSYEQYAEAVAADLYCERIIETLG